MKKKLVGMLISLSLLLTLLLGSTSIALAGDCPNIRVLLTIGSPTSFGFTLNGSYNISVGGVVQRALSPAVYTAVVEGSNVSVKDGGGGTVASGPDVTLSPIGDCTINITHPEYKARNYKGDFKFTVSGGALQLINTLNLETYLCGVLPHEMSNSFPLEALKAQAVCARTFSALRMAGAGSSAYDLDDTGARAQVYKGYDPSTDRCIQAVNETVNQVLKYGDTAFVNCYYSASNGGWTEITQHRWTATEALKAYDQIRFDPYDIANPSSLQERLVLPVTITPENPLQYQKWSNGVYAANANSPAGVDTASRYLRLCALQAVRDKGYIANVTDDIQILGFSNVTAKTYDNSSGQQHGGEGSYNGNDVTGKNDCKDMTQADVTMKVLASRYARTDETSGYMLGDVDRNGSISIADYTYVRLYILGRQALPDEAIKIADVDRNGSVSISDYTYIRLHILGLKPIDGRTNDGIVREPVDVTFTINLTDMDVGATYQSFFVSSLGLFTAEGDGTNWYIYQRRYGHGIGLSQRGAEQRANTPDPAVNTYTAILDFYFPDFAGCPDVHIATLY